VQVVLDKSAKSRLQAAHSAQQPQLGAAVDNRDSHAVEPEHEFVGSPSESNVGTPEAWYPVSGSAIFGCRRHLEDR